MEFDELMKGFGAEVGIKDFGPDENGVFALVIDDMNVEFEEVPGSNQFVIRSAVGELPPEGRERLYRTLLDAMYMGEVTGGACFSFIPDSNIVCLFRFVFLLQSDVSSFKKDLEKFVNTLEEWRRIVSAFSALSPELAEAEKAKSKEQRELSLGGFLQV